jgi:hypothetical protein
MSYRDEWIMVFIFSYAFYSPPPVYLYLFSRPSQRSSHTAVPLSPLFAQSSFTLYSALAKFPLSGIPPHRSDWRVVLFGHQSIFSLGFGTLSIESSYFRCYEIVVSRSEIKLRVGVEYLRWEDGRIGIFKVPICCSSQFRSL